MVTINAHVRLISLPFRYGFLRYREIAVRTSCFYLTADSASGKERRREKESAIDRALSHHVQTATCSLTSRPIKIFSMRSNLTHS